MDKLDGMSLNVEQVEMEKLRAVFPQCFSEGKLDWKKLEALVGECDDTSEEKYRFEWNGKRDSLKLAQTRSTGTLRPAPEESIDWDTTQNLYIEGDNLEVLKLLQTAYYRRVKMIYIDPPYNTGNDFVYNDDFADPMSRYKEITSQMTKSNPEVAGRYHTNWLNMMYPRLRLAANLLRDDGAIFISIDDNEVTNLRKLCDEVFGEENFIAQVIVQTNPRGRTFDRFIAKTHEYVLVYSKFIDLDGLHEVPKDEKAIAAYSKKDENGNYRLLELRNRNPVFNRTNRPLMFFPLYADPDKLDVSMTQTDRHTIEIYPRNSQGEDGCWTWGVPRTKANTHLLVANHANTGKWSVFRKDYLEGTSLYTKSKGLWLEKEMNHENGKEMVGQLFGKAPFDFPKSVDYIKKCLLLGTSPHEEDIVLDFFSGSATTAHAVMQLNAEDGGNRKFIMVQLPELIHDNLNNLEPKNICEIGKMRIRLAGSKIKAELGSSDEPKSNNLFADAGDAEVESRPALDTGFKVFKLDDSNLAAWNTTPIEEGDLPELWDRFTALTETIKGNRSELDVVYEVMAKMGVPLTYPVKEITVGTKKTYSVGDNNMLLVCLEKGITPEDVEAMCDLAPYWIIAAEEAFADDSALSNAHYTVKARNIKMELL